MCNVKPDKTEVLEMLTVITWMFLGMVGIFFLAATDSSAATEQRCKELGENCVCSEPFDAPSYTYRAPNYYLNDSGKPCSLEAPGSGLARNSSDLFMTNDRAIVGRLTSAPIYVIRGPEGHVNLWFVGHFVNDATRFMKRMAYRWYVYYSPNFEFSMEGSCTNGKLVQMEDTTSIGATITIANNAIGMYNFYNWPPLNSDCCWRGPSFGDHGPTYAEWKGKWWRLEVVVTNRQGGPSPNGVRVQLYLMNVTDHAAERLVIDTYGLDYGGPNLYVPHNDFTFPSPLARMRPSLYRQDRCNGYNALSSYMLAGWDTDVGQRIGPALEIEAGGDVTPPAAPTKPQNLLR